MNRSNTLTCLALGVALLGSGCNATDTESVLVDSGADSALPWDASTDASPPQDSGLPDGAPDGGGGDAGAPDGAVGDASLDAWVDGGDDGGFDGGDGGDAGDGGDGGVDTCSAEITCDESAYCEYEEVGACNVDGAVGTCATRPAICTDEVAPVCGCDSVTYSNACEARAAGVDVVATGECDCRVMGCSTGSSCSECLGSSGSVYVCLGDGAAC